MHYNYQRTTPHYYTSRRLLEKTQTTIRSAAAEAALDQLYADVLPQAPTVRMTESCRIFHRCWQDNVN